MNHYLLDAPAPGGGSMMLPMLLILVVFFVFMILPQMRKQKKAKQYFSELQKGDRIVTTGGIHGKITSIDEKFFIIEVEEGKLKIEKSFVSMELSMSVYKTKNEEKPKD